ncbi:MAG: TetR family transcriptional regulator [Acidimicrobiales bacterium]
MPSPPVTLVPLSLSDLVALTGVPASTVHHYLRAGLIPAPDRRSSNRFTYDERHVTALRYIRAGRDRGRRIEVIAEELPEHLAGPAGGTPVGELTAGGVRDRLLDAATEAFRTRSYGEVTVGEIAGAARVGKGSVYLHFSSKQEIFTATIERLLERAAADFAETVERLGGPGGLASAPEKTAAEFARLVAVTMPVLLELGARAAKGHEPSQELARRVLATMAEAAGRPFTPGSSGGEAGPEADRPEAGRPEAGRPAAPDGGRVADRGCSDPIPAGLAVIKGAFATVLTWATGPDWPEGVWPDDDLAEPDDEEEWHHRPY